MTSYFASLMKKTSECKVFVRLECVGLSGPPYFCLNNIIYKDSGKEKKDHHAVVMDEVRAARGKALHQLCVAACIHYCTYSTHTCFCILY